MKVAVAGASGLIGSAVVPHLQSRGHLVYRLVRRPVRDAAAEIEWHPETGAVEPVALAGFDVIINLAGENIGEGRWSEERKRRIRDSRVETTRLLAGLCAALDPQPKAFLSASATGYYGDTGERAVDESAQAGDTFLADVCRQSEEAAQPAAEAGIRVVNFRLGVVLSRQGGMLHKILPLFRLGLGGRLGDGRQYLPWVTLEDVARAFEYFITNEPIRGPVNVVAPQPVTNAEFTQALGAALQRPTLFRVPAGVIRAVFGQMGRETILSGCRAVPARLSTQGFRFKHADLVDTLRAELDRPG